MRLVVSHRVEGETEDVLELFILSRAEEQGSAVDVRDEPKRLRKGPLPDAFVVLHAA